MALTVKIRGDATHLEKTLQGVKKGVGGLASGLAKFTAAGAGFAAMMAGVQSVEAVVSKLAGFLTESSMKAAGVESLTMQFETLLGSAKAAQERMAEIKEFAASTPFEVANLSATSKLLQTLGGTMLATGSGLRMVGDAAAIAGQPIEEIGLHIGRVFNAITSGTSAGDSVGRLQELGLMSGAVKIQFEELAEAQKKGEVSTMSSGEALKLLQEVFKKTEGAMARLAQTTDGKLSNLTDNFDNLKVAFGTGMNEGLKVALDAANEGLPKLEKKFATMGKGLGDAIRDAVNGKYDIFVAIGGVIGTAIKHGLISAIGSTSNEIVKGVADLALRAADKLSIERFRGENANLTDEQFEAMQAERRKANIEKLLGPDLTTEQRGMAMSETFRPAMENLRETITRRDIERQTEIMQKTLQAIEALPGSGIMGDIKGTMEYLYSR
jgi:hypothetical protein